MTFIWARGVWRRQLWSLIALGVIAGLGVGGSLVAMAGARRADSAYDRLEEATLGPDLTTTLDDDLYEELAARPEVAAAARFVSFTPVAPEPLVPGVDAGAVAAIDEDFLVDVYRPAIIDGRLPDADAADEVLINEELADVGDLEPGERVSLTSGFADQGPLTPLGEVTVVGIARGQFDVGPNSLNASVLLPFAFVEAHRDELAVFETPALIRLRDGEDPAEFDAAATELAGRELAFQTAEEDADPINRALDVQFVGYLALAGVLAAATTLMVVQGIARQVRSALTPELRILVAIGMAPRARHLLALVLAIPVIVVGAVLALAVAIAGSPLVPTGLARTIDLDTGIQVDATVLLVGLIGLVVVLALLASAVAWGIRVNPAERPSHPSRTSRALRQLPLRTRLGAELALAPRRSPAGPAARSALIATAVATGAVLGVGVFAASADRLLDPGHPELTGWDFDIAVTADQDLDPAAFTQGLEAALEKAPPDAMSRVSVVYLLIGKEPLEAFVFEPDDHPVHPTMRDGRPPVAADEIALGLARARQLGVSIGDSVDVSAFPIGAPDGLSDPSDGHKRSVRVVGIASYPQIGEYSDIGNAGSITTDLADDLGAQNMGGGVLLRYDEDIDDATVEALDAVGDPVQPFLGPTVQRLDEVGGIPRVLAILLSLLGAAAIGHGLIRAALDRRRDFAVLRAMGMRPRDVRVIVASQGVVTAVVGGTIGVLLGLMVGPWVWERVADSVSAVRSVAVPTALLVGIVPAAVALALVTSLWPAWRASRHAVVEVLAADDLRA